MGKWILEQERNNTPFTKSTQWNKLTDIHTKLHSDVQHYVNKNAQKAANNELEQIAKRIEDETLEIFDNLNGVLEVHCDSIKS